MKWIIKELFKRYWKFAGRKIWSIEAWIEIAVIYVYETQYWTRSCNLWRLLCGSWNHRTWKLFTDGETIKERGIAVDEELYSEKVDLFKSAKLTANTVVRGIELSSGVFFFFFCGLGLVNGSVYNAQVIANPKSVTHLVQKMLNYDASNRSL